MGFDDDLQETLERIDDDNVMSWKDPDGFEYVAAYADPSGVTLSLFTPVDQYPQETFALRNPCYATVETFQVTPGVVAVDMVDEEGELQNRFLVTVDDPQMYPTYPLKEVGELQRYGRYQLGAVAQDLKIFDSVTDWENHTKPIGAEGLRMGPRFTTSPWLFALYGGDATAEEASSISIFVAICEEVEKVRNHLTGRQWYRIKANCGFSCTLALPIDASPAPHVGSVVDGKAFLTGSTGIWQYSSERRRDDDAE